MVKNMKFRETMRILGLRTYENSSEKSIFRNLFDVYQSIGLKSCTKDSSISQCVLTSIIIGKEMEKSRIISKISNSLRISRTTLVKTFVRKEKIENSDETSFWSPRWNPT